MIKILNVQGRSAPVLICDICDQAIKNVGLAAAVFPRSDVEGELSPVLHVHKGTCLDRADVRVAAASHAPWQELTHHLVWLLQNVGMDAAALANASASANTLNRIS